MGIAHQLTLSRKILYVIMILGVFLSTFTSKIPIAHASDSNKPLSATVVLFEEDFEGSFGNGTNGWTVEDLDSYGTTAYWNDVDSSFGGEGTAHGSKKAYAAANSSSAYCGSTTNPSYPMYMESSMSRTIDLSQMNTAQLSFWYKIPAFANEGSEGWFSVSGDTGGRVISYRASGGPITSWTQQAVDLGNYVGDSSVEISWHFNNVWSTNCSASGEGMYLDYIQVTGTAEGDPVTGQITSVSDSPDPIDAGQQIGITVGIENTGYVTWTQWRFTVNIYEMYTTSPLLYTQQEVDGSDIAPDDTDSRTMQFSVPANWAENYQYNITAEAYYNGTWQQIDYEEWYYFHVNSITAITLDSQGLDPSHPRVAVGESFTVQYYITNPTSSNQTVYLLARSRTPSGAYAFLQDTSGQSATPVTVTPGANWYTRSAVVYGSAPVADNYSLTLFISPTTNYGDAYDSSDISNAFDVVLGNQKPACSIVSPPSPASNSTINYDDVTFQWQCSDSDGLVQGYEYMMDGNASSTRLTITTFNNLSEGPHTFRIRCFDDDSVYSDWVSGNFTISLDDPLIGLFGFPAVRYPVVMFGQNYTIIGMTKVADPLPDEMIYLPFYGNPQSPDSTNLVTDPGLAELIYKKYIFEEKFIDPYDVGRTLQMEIDNQFVPLRDYYKLDNWWDIALESSPPTWLVSKVFSKRKVDRITIGNGAIWTGGEVLEAKVTGGSSLIMSGINFIEFLLQQGDLSDLQEEEYQYLTFAQTYYGGDLNTFQQMNTLSHMPDLTTLLSMKESAQWSKDFLDIEVAYTRLEDAVNVGDFEGSKRYSADLEQGIKSLGFKFAVKLAEQMIIEPSGAFILQDEAKLAAWLSDAHCEGIYSSAKDLEIIGTKIRNSSLDKRE